MRFKDFKPQIQEEDDLLEIRMDPTSLEKASQDADVRVGIEFEMVVPGNSSDLDDPEMEADYSYDTSADDITEIVDFFYDGDYNSRGDALRLEAALREDFAVWASEQFESRWEADREEFVNDYLRNNVDAEEIAEILGLDIENIDGFTKDQIYQAVDEIITQNLMPYIDDARDNAYENFIQEADESDWLDDVGFTSMQDIVRNYDIVWPYYEYINNDNDGNTIQMIADEFSEAIGKPVNVSQSYHGAKREPGKYSVEPDGSIDADDGEVGLEFISPPMSMTDMIKDLELIKVWAKKTGARTNKSTGLHMNISVPGLNDQTLDYVKLALLLGDQYVLQQFGRQANTYTKSALDKIKDKIKNYTPEEIEKYLSAIKSKLNVRAGQLLNIDGFGKYTSINPKSGYIEFRSPGGDYLNEPTEKLVNTLRRFVVATKAAIDPDAYRKEYVSKLVKLLNPPNQKTDDTIEYFAKFSAGELPKQALKSFIKQTQLQRQAQRQRLAAGQKIEWEVSKRSEINNPNRSSLRVLAASEEEAREQATTSGMGWTWLDPDQLIARPAPPQVNTSGLPPPELNGRPSNPDGNAYIATIQQPDTPLYRFMAANGDDARTVLDQWERTHGGNYVWRPDPQQERGQPAIPGSTIDLARRRAAAAQSPSLNLTAPTWYPDANYAIVRNSDQAVIEYFIRNTPAEAESAYARWLNNIGAEPSVYTLIPLTPRPSSAEQTNQDIVGWRILLSTGEEVHRGNNPGIDQQEATQRAASWLRNNGYGVVGEGFRVEPIYRGEEDTPYEFDGDRNTQWRILVGGEEVHRFWNRAIQSEANQAARQWILDQIRRGLLAPEQGADIEVVPVQT